MSRSEEILTAIAEGATTEIEPTCRKETFLKAIANGNASNLPEPTCREEVLLKQIAENGTGGGEVDTEDLIITPTTSEQTITRSIDKYINSVTVEAIQTEEKTVTENGEVSPSDGKFISKVTVNVQPNLTTKEITTNGTFNASDDGVDGYSSVHVRVGDSVDRLQYKCDNVKLLAYEFYCDDDTSDYYTDENVTATLQGIDTSNVVSMAYMFAASKTSYAKYKDLSGITIDAESCENFFSAFSNQQTLLKAPKIINTSNVTSMNSMFNKCTKLTTLDVSGFDTSNVTNMSSMFGTCESLTTLDVSGFDTSNVTNMQNTFLSCISLTTLDVSGFDTSKVTNMYGTFQACKKLTTLDVSGFDTSKVTNMQSMFSGCASLTNLNLSNFDTSNVTNMQGMFSACESLTNLNLSNFDTSKVTNMSNMFSGCTTLTEIIGVIDLIKTSSASYTTNMFSTCKALTTVTLKNIKNNLQIGSGTTYGHLLTLDTLLNIIKELHINTSTSTRKLTVGSANLNKLNNVYVKLVDITDNMRVEDTYIDNKTPFEVCESTDEGALHIVNDYLIMKNWQIA